MTHSTPDPFEEVEHVADAALKVYGRDWGELLVNAAHGMFSLMADCQDTQASTQHEISLRATDREILLVDWLSELLYLHEMENVVYTSFEIVQASPCALQAIVKGTDRWKPQTAVKAVTFNDLHIKRTPQGYTATVVFDT